MHAWMHACTHTPPAHPSACARAPPDPPTQPPTQPPSTPTTHPPVEMSMDSTGSLWPYRDRKNLRESAGAQAAGPGSARSGMRFACGMHPLLHALPRAGAAPAPPCPACSFCPPPPPRLSTHPLTRKEDPHSGVQQRRRQQLAVGADAHAQHVVRHFEGAAGKRTGEGADAAKTWSWRAGGCRGRGAGAAPARNWAVHRGPSLLRRRCTP